MGPQSPNPILNFSAGNSISYVIWIHDAVGYYVHFLIPQYNTLRLSFIKQMLDTYYFIFITYSARLNRNMIYTMAILWYIITLRSHKHTILISQITNYYWYHCRVATPCGPCGSLKINGCSGETCQQHLTQKRRLTFNGLHGVTYTTQDLSFLVFKKSRARIKPLTLTFSQIKCSTKSVSVMTTNIQIWDRSSFRNIQFQSIKFI
jgi:hypothetical protein